jgi:hypothetical protein
MAATHPERGSSHHPDRSGDTVARAKRTARAEARRRYRNEQGLAATDAGSDLESSTPPTAAAATKPSPGPDARRSIGAAFREAFRPVDLRSDLRALPRLILHRAFWIPALLTLASLVAFIVVRPEGRNDILSILTVFLFQYFIVTPAIGGVFIAGFMAPRASWLLGVLVGLVAAACYSFLVLNGYVGTAPTEGTASIARDVVIAAFIMSPIVGAFFASTAAWYRRFLYLSNPNRGRRPPAGAPGRPDGRTRTAGASQKASR